MAGLLRRTVTSVTLVALLLPLAAVTSLADTGPAPIEVFKFSENGSSASAQEGDCPVVDDIETCTFTGVFLFSGNRREHGSGAIHGTQVCYDTAIEVFNHETGELLSSNQEHGCTTDVGEGTVIERDLSAATIAPTTITLETFTCEIECGPTGETRDVTIAGTFTATSSAIRESFRNVFDDGICIARFSSRGTSREAMFSGTVDGEPLELGANLHQGTNSGSQRCAIEP